MKTSKKMLAAGLIVAAGLSERAQAVIGNPVDIIVTVTVQKLSITASNRTNASATIALGNVIGGTQNVSPIPVTITNSGNVTETYTLSIPSEPNLTWASATAAPGTESYQMSGVFRAPAAGAPVSANYVDNQDDYSVATPRAADGANHVAVNADGGGPATKGFQMTIGSNVYLWLRFGAPTLTEITTEQSIINQITAATP